MYFDARCVVNLWKSYTGYVYHVRTMVEHTLTNLWNTNVMRFTQETSWTSVSDIGLARSLSFSSIPPAAAALLYGGWILCLYFVGMFLKFYYSWRFSPYQFGCVKKFRSNRVFTHTGWRRRTTDEHLPFRTHNILSAHFAKIFGNSLVLNYRLIIHTCIDIWILLIYAKI